MTSANITILRACAEQNVVSCMNFVGGVMLLDSPYPSPPTGPRGICLICV